MVSRRPNFWLFLVLFPLTTILLLDSKWNNFNFSAWSDQHTHEQSFHLLWIQWRVDSITEVESLKQFLVIERIGCIYTELFRCGRPHQIAMQEWSVCMLFHIWQCLYRSLCDKIKWTLKIFFKITLGCDFLIGRSSFRPHDPAPKSDPMWTYCILSIYTQKPKIYQMFVRRSVLISQDRPSQSHHSIMGRSFSSF